MKVTMINSVDEWVAGEEYDLETATADVLILKGYADGELSRDYDAAEQDSIRADMQVVNV